MCDELKCPRCGEPCERDYVDVGLGEVPCGPWGCPACWWVEGQDQDAVPAEVTKRRQQAGE